MFSDKRNPISWQTAGNGKSVAHVNCRIRNLATDAHYTFIMGKTAKNVHSRSMSTSALMRSTQSVSLLPDYIPETFDVGEYVRQHYNSNDQPGLYVAPSVTTLSNTAELFDDLSVRDAWEDLLQQASDVTQEELQLSAPSHPSSVASLTSFRDRSPLR